jgi:hypothetical protein
MQCFAHDGIAAGFEQCGDDQEYQRRQALPSEHYVLSLTLLMVDAAIMQFAHRAIPDPPSPCCHRVATALSSPPA